MRIAKGSSSHSPKRRADRLAIVLPISIYVPGSGDLEPERTNTRDISRAGIAFESTEHYRTGTKLHISFHGGSNPAKTFREIPAQIVRVSRLSRGKKFVVGGRFTDNIRASAALAELLRIQMRISQALLQIINAISPTAGVKENVKRISQAAARVMEAEQVHLFLPDKEPGILSAVAGKAGQMLRIRYKKSLFGNAASVGVPTNAHWRWKRPLLTTDFDLPFKSNARSVLCIPLIRKRGTVSGLLVALNKRHGPFTPEDEELGMAIANQISVVLREASLLERISNIRKFNEHILASMASAVISIDKHGNLTSANRSAAKIFGFHPRIAMGKGLVDLLNRTSNTRLCRVVDDMLRVRKRQTAYDVRLVRADRTDYSLNLTAVPTKTSKGEFSGAVLVAEDITMEQRFMSTLSRYLAREVADQILRNKELGKLGGTRAEATILVADIRNFTSLSEKMDPKDLMDLLNAYFPPMINAIFRHQGMVDKFMGDAILAVFGVPVRQDDDALRAVLAAIEMRRELAKMNKTMDRTRGITLEMGIGITSGTVISGNLGSERRMDFTVIGDPVNLASRLEGLTKEVKRKVLISESVYKVVEKTVPCEFLGLFKVKGKSNKVPAYAVQTPEQDLPSSAV